MNFVFVHGWGYDRAFWDGVLTILPELNDHRIDLGFLQQAEDKTALLVDQPAVYITHSLGTMWALKNRPAQMKGLVAINGFGCFQNFVGGRVLAAMQKRLGRNAKQQMEEFWQMCGAKPEGTLNEVRLAEGLSWLVNWDEGAALSDLSCPVLSLAGDADNILPLDIIKQEWHGFDLKICEGGDHVLPVSNAAWCADQIKAFVDEL